MLGGESGCGCVIADMWTRAVPDEIIGIVGATEENVPAIGFDEHRHPGFVDPGVVEEVRVLPEGVDIVEVVLRRVVVAHDQDRAAIDGGAKNLSAGSVCFGVHAASSNYGPSIMQGCGRRKRRIAEPSQPNIAALQTGHGWRGFHWMSRIHRIGLESSHCRSSGEPQGCKGRKDLQIGSPSPARHLALIDATSQAGPWRSFKSLVSSMPSRDALYPSAMLR